ncbi:MAG: Phosphate regulon transcriptional regulatory protein PhoB (SphR) [uncultured Thiotrichaceae bacterium]|uniref:Phosphate regulon transcriptional regulatory protein PhoB (SphR) n=1 Tax=uncultured Thiotrichaceae bacterium TaxID=298394 RepID=A0A6S6T8Z3_9GAMM|nr:MAG: Phosphate regulon transcriptional regulatory protein PhoB (SphR) [uncultured Thiotrichaceae bacterium]
MFTVLIVEDDHAIRDMLNMFLTSKRYEVKIAENGKQALEALSEMTPDVMLLDWMLPDTDGPTLLTRIRNNPIHQKLAVLMLTARAEEADKIKGLDVGADDYMTKPVSLQELDARIRALIRRAQGLNEQNLIQQGPITLDPENQKLTINGEPVKIGMTEFRLLHFLMINPNRLYTRVQLLDSVWGQSTFIEERTVDTHVMRLRKTLKPSGADSMLETIRGMGYRFVDSADGS